jgi:ferredoxin
MDARICRPTRPPRWPASCTSGSVDTADGRDKALGMRIVVDLNRCQGYGQCVFLAPSVFELHGEEALMYDPGPDEEQLIPVVRAAAACPVQAIRVERPGNQA